jgi:hypothetical protein
MLDFCFYCKSYLGDFPRLLTLVTSFRENNSDKLKLYVSVPESDLDKIPFSEDENVKIITDESFAANYLTKNGSLGMSVGYVNQQICKMVFFKTSFSKNYLCLDSDSYFIRNFFKKDFMYNDDTPYTVLVMDKDLAIEKHYKNKHWIGRTKGVSKIYNFMELEDSRLRTCHNTQVFNYLVLKSMEKNFLEVKGMAWKDLFKISPYEFTWYNVWFQKSKVVKEIAVEPFFKTLHMREEYIHYRLKNLKQEDIAFQYVGIILNSKWRPWRAPLKYKNPGIFFKFFYFITRWTL